MDTIDFERLDAYRVARELHRELDALLRAAPRVRQDLVDQARRAAASIVLNIAEGAGEWSPREKARFYRFAKRSATETAAVLDLLGDVNVLPAADQANVRTLLERTFAMLIRLSKASEPGGPAPTRNPHAAPRPQPVPRPARNANAPTQPVTRAPPGHAPRRPWSRQQVGSRFGPRARARNPCPVRYAPAPVPVPRDPSRPRANRYPIIL